MKYYNGSDIDQAFDGVGLSKGDVVFVTTSLGMLGVPENVKSQDELNALFYQKLLDRVGEEGTLIIPAYSYTFGKHKVTSPAFFEKNTPPEIGPFPNYVLKQESVYRSKDPFMSVLAVGRKAKDIVSGLTSSSYGCGSIFEKLLNYSAKCLTIGLGPNWTAFIHYLDWLEKVPFRYDKLFPGYFNQENEKSVWLYSVPVLNKKASANAHEIGIKAEIEGIWSYSTLGRARVYLADYNSYFDYCQSAIKNDPWLFATEKNWNVLDEEKSRVNYCLPSSNLDDFIKKYKDYEFATLSEEVDFIFSFLPRDLWQEIKVKSGENFFDHVIPEAWKCQRCTFRYNDKILLSSTQLVQPYSQSFQGIVSKYDLEIHSSLVSDFPAYIERDWRLINHPPLEVYPSYDIDLLCDTYMSEMCIRFSGGIDNQVIILVDISIHSGREILCNLVLNPDIALRLSKNNISLAFISGKVALAVVLEKFSRINSIIYLNNNIKKSYLEAGFNPIATSSLLDINVTEYFLSDIEDAFSLSAYS